MWVIWKESIQDKEKENIRVNITYTLFECHRSIDNSNCFYFLCYREKFHGSKEFSQENSKPRHELQMMNLLSNTAGQFLPIHFQQNGEWAHLQGLKLDNINPSDVTVEIGADGQEDVFKQLNIRKGKEGQPYGQSMEAVKIVLQQRRRKLLVIQCYQVNLSQMMMWWSSGTLNQRLLKVLIRVAISKRMLNV